MVRHIFHAKDRMRERSIYEAEIEDTLARPLEVVPTKYNRSAACSLKEGGRCLVVVFERSQEELFSHHSHESRLEQGEEIWLH
jgi:hypothetical protein